MIRQIVRGTERHIFPALALDDWGREKKGPGLHRWLYEHPRFGPPLIAWEEKRAVSVSAKWTACGLMASSWLIMVLMTDGWLVPAFTGLMFVCGGTYLVTRPAP